MNDKKPLSLRQRQILFLMREADGPTHFHGETRGFYWRKMNDDHPGALTITAYQDPELFLARRGLIERVEMNVPGRWFRLTEHGQARAKAIREFPR